MRVLNGGNAAHPRPPIGSRRGAVRSSSSSWSNIDHRTILALLAMSATIFAVGLVFGTRALHGHDVGDGHRATRTTNGKGGVGGGPELSPLAAATSRLMPKDIQNLILESANAEIEERKERIMEEKALKEGNYVAAAHLRGLPAPGDANYNPHRHMDDAFAGEGEDFGGEGGDGDGGMYAGDIGDHRDVPNGVGHHFLDAIKGELKHDGERIVEGMHKLKEKARGVANNVVKRKLEKHGLLRGHGDGGHVADDEDREKGKSHPVKRRKGGGSIDRGEGMRYFPYMTLAVPANYDFSRYEPLGGGRFVEYRDGDSPYDITDKIMEQSDELARSRRVHVANAMRHVWKNYKELAFGKDEIKPISGDTTNRWGGMGTT